MATIEQKPVLIIGAGIGGFALAQALQTKKVPYRLFERDSRVDARLQGYRFALQTWARDAFAPVCPPELVADLKAAAPIIHPDEEHMAEFFDAVSGHQFTQEEGWFPIEGERPLPTDRGTMRGLLARSVDTEYSKKFVSYEILPDGVRAHFEDGSSAEGSLLVAADGLHSRVRKQLIPDYKLLDTKGRWIWGKTDITPEFMGKVDSRLAKGMKLIRDMSDPNRPKSLFLEFINFNRDVDHPIPGVKPTNDYAYWVIQAHEDHFKGLSEDELHHLSAEKILDLSHSLTSKWFPGFQPIFDHQNIGSAQFQPLLCADPNIVSWDSDGKVTMIGDAVHSMPPTAGSGASSAVRDGAELATALAEGGINKESVAAFEKKMREYGEACIRLSDVRSQKIFGAKPLAEMDRAGQ